jgi:hypothetical protein
MPTIASWCPPRRQASVPRLLALLVLTSLAVGACKRERRAAEQLPLAPAPNTRAPKREIVAAPWRPSYDLRLQMAKMQLFAAEARRRIEGGYDVTGAAKVIAKQASELHTRGAPQATLELIRALRARAEVLAGGKASPKASFNALIDTCAGCHHNQAQSALPKIEALKIP